MPQVEEIRTFEGFLGLKPAWDKLLAESDNDVVFMTFEWFRFWWQAFGKDSEMRVLLVKDAEEIIAIVPLMIKKTKWRGLPIRALSFMANYHSNRSGMIIGKKGGDIGAALMSHLKERSAEFDMMQLYFIVNGSQTDLRIREGLAANRFRYCKLPGARSPYIPLSGNWDDYFHFRSRNFRHKLNRLQNKYKRLKEWQIMKYTNADIDRAMQELIEVSKKSWKHKGGTAIGSDENLVNFYSSLAEFAAREGILNIWILKIGKKPAAFIFNLKYGQRIYSLKIGFDQEQEKFSPGEFLNLKAIKESFENNYREYDWLGEGLSFKMKWTDQDREHCKYWIFNDTFYGRLLAFLELDMISGLRDCAFTGKFFKRRSRFDHRCH